jgi:hypothetical protein
VFRSIKQGLFNRFDFSEDVRLARARARDLREGKGTSDSSQPVSRQEFRQRYRNAQATAFVPLIALLYSLTKLALTDSLLGKAICLLVAVIGALAYISLAFSLWRAREQWRHWGEDKPPARSGGDWLDAALTHWLEALPMALEWRHRESGVGATTKKMIK